VIEQVVLALGIKGIIAATLGLALIAVGGYAKVAIATRDAKIADKTAQVQRVAMERDNLLNANRQLSESLRKQGESIANYMTAAAVQKGRADEAAKRLNSVQEEYQAYIRHLDSSIGQGDRWGVLGDTYQGAAKDWNLSDLDGKNKAPKL